MRVTARGLNRSSLGRQLLLRRESLSVTEAVRRVVALAIVAAQGTMGVSTRYAQVRWHE